MDPPSRSNHMSEFASFSSLLCSTLTSANRASSAVSGGNGDQSTIKRKFEVMAPSVATSSSKNEFPTSTPASTSLETSLSAKKASGASSTSMSCVRESRATQVLGRVAINKIICKLPIVAPDPSYLSHLSSKDLKALLCGKSNGDTKTNRLTKLELMQHVWKLMQTSVFEHSLEELKHLHSTGLASESESMHIDILSKDVPPSSSSSSAYFSEAAKSIDNWEPVEADLSHALNAWSHPTTDVLSSTLIGTPNKDKPCETVPLPCFASDVLGEYIIASIPADCWGPTDEGTSDALEALIGNEDYFAYKVLKQYIDQMGTDSEKQGGVVSSTSNGDDDSDGETEGAQHLATAEIVDGLAQCFSSLCARRSSSATSEQNNQQHVDSMNDFDFEDSPPTAPDSLNASLEEIVNGVKVESEALEEVNINVSKGTNTVVDEDSIEACISTYKAVKFVSVSQASLGISLEMKHGAIKVTNNGMGIDMARHVLVGDALVYVQGYYMSSSSSFADLLRHIKAAQRPIMLGFVST